VSYRIDANSPLPPSQQLVQAVADAIARGAIPPGERLPSVRKMAQEALVNPNTVVKAYTELAHFGLVEGQNGSGVFVLADAPAKARELRREETLSALRAALHAALRAGHPPARIAKEMEDALAESGASGRRTR
jgi:DNA-binding transcriptional regulator YhcF (GntR family)